MMSHDLLVQMAYFPRGTTNQKYASSVWNFCSRSSNVTGFAGRPKVASRNVFVFSGLFISKEFTLTETFTLDVQWHIVSKNAFIWYVLHLTEYAFFFFVHAEIYPQTPSQFYRQGYFPTWHNCLACKFNKWINKQKKGVKTLQKSFSSALAEKFSTKIFDIAFWWVFLSIVYNEENYNGETSWSISTWIKENKSRNTSAVFEHIYCQATGHSIKPHNVKVLQTTPSSPESSRRPLLLTKETLPE